MFILHVDVHDTYRIQLFPQPICLVTNSEFIEALQGKSALPRKQPVETGLIQNSDYCASNQFQEKCQKNYTLDHLLARMTESHLFIGRALKLHVN